MTLLRIFSVASMTLLAAPCFAATNPFSVTPADAPRAIIMVTGAEACAGEAAAAQAALAAQAGRRVGIVAADAVCGAARAVMDQSPDIAFANDADALGAAPNAFLAENREAGIFVWDMESYRALDLSGRQVLGVFEDAAAAPMIDAALDHLSAAGDGYFLLVQADALDGAALAALDRARDAGAEVVAPGLVHTADFSALD